jgi:hypothetical protein
MPKNVNRSLSFPVKIGATLVQDGVPTEVIRTGIATWTRTRIGTSCPDYVGKIARGENATTSLTGVFDDGYHGRSNGSVVSVYNFAPPHTTQKMFKESDIAFVPNNLAQTRAPRDPVSSATEAINAAASQFYSKLRSQQVILAGMTALGELPETLRMLRRPGEAFYKGSKDFIDALKKAKRRSPKDWMKTASGLWLEHSFGWQPAINDALTAAKALRSLDKERSAKVSGGAQRTYDRTSSLPAGDNQSNIADVMSTRWNCTATLSERHTVRFRAGLRAQAEVPQWGGKLAAFGFKPEEFIPTIYNLLPWSFLADYFTNLGDMIDANATDTSRVAWISRSIISETFYKGSYACDIGESGNTPKANWTTGGTVSPATWYFHRKRVTRSSDVALPIVTFTLETGTSLGQKLNMLALLGQANELHHQDFRWRRG